VVVVDKVIVLLVIEKVQMADRVVAVIIEPTLLLPQVQVTAIQVLLLLSIHPQVPKGIQQERELTVEDKPVVVVEQAGQVVVQVRQVLPAVTEVQVKRVQLLAGVYIMQAVAVAARKTIHLSVQVVKVAVVLLAEFL
jgi:hypothetical protein